MRQDLHDSDPRRVGDYLLEARLGAGGMGVVYLARDAVGTPVAVKVIKPDLLDRDDRAGLVRFRREITALRKLDRYCTARLLDAVPDGEPPYYVTEYITGPTLAEAVRADGSLDEAALEAVATGIAAALRHIHGAGITHRDLKPQNVLLGPYGPRVIDFGLALHVEMSQRISSGLVLGTPGYMAPEQVRGGEVGPPADVFAWGAVMLFAATGRPPFGTGDFRAICFRILEEEPDLAGVPDRFAQIIGPALAKNPGDRPTAAHLLDRLRALPGSQTVLATARQGTDASPAGAADAEDWAELAERSLAAGRARLALFQADKGIERDPMNAHCHHQRGLACVELGNGREGFDALYLAYEMVPDDREIARSYAHALIDSRGADARSDQAARNPYRIAPDDERVISWYLESLIGSGMLRVNNIDEARRLAIESPAAAECLVRLLLEPSNRGRWSDFGIGAHDRTLLHSYATYEPERRDPDDEAIMARYVELVVGSGHGARIQPDRARDIDILVRDIVDGTGAAPQSYRRLSPAARAVILRRLAEHGRELIAEAGRDKYRPDRAIRIEQLADRALALRPPQEIAGQFSALRDQAYAVPEHGGWGCILGAFVAPATTAALLANFGLSGTSVPLSVGAGLLALFLLFGLEAIMQEISVRRRRARAPQDT